MYAETLQPLSRRRLFAEISTAHKHTHSKSPPNEWTARRTGRYLHNTQQTQQTNIHTVCGIRTRDPSNPAAGDAGFRRLSHWERFVNDTRMCKLMADINERQCHLLSWRAEQNSSEMRPMHSAVLAAGGTRRERKLIHRQNFHLADLSSNPTFNSTCPQPPAPTTNPVVSDHILDI